MNSSFIFILLIIAPLYMGIRIKLRTSKHLPRKITDHINASICKRPNCFQIKKEIFLQTQRHAECSKWRQVRDKAFKNLDTIEKHIQKLDKLKLQKKKLHVSKKIKVEKKSKEVIQRKGVLKLRNAQKQYVKKVKSLIKIQQPERKPYEEAQLPGNRAKKDITKKGQEIWASEQKKISRMMNHVLPGQKKTRALKKLRQEEEKFSLEAEKDTQEEKDVMKFAAENKKQVKIIPKMHESEKKFLKLMNEFIGNKQKSLNMKTLVKIVNLQLSSRHLSSITTQSLTMNSNFNALLQIQGKHEQTLHIITRIKMLLKKQDKLMQSKCRY